MIPSNNGILTDDKNTDPNPSSWTLVDKWIHFRDDSNIVDTGAGAIDES